MTAHTITHEIEISLTSGILPEIENAHPEFEITFEYTPGCEAQTYGPAEKCYPAEAAQIEFIGAKAIKDDGMDLTPEQITGYAENWLLGDGYQAALNEVQADFERRMPE